MAFDAKDDQGQMMFAVEDEAVRESALNLALTIVGLLDTFDVVGAGVHMLMC